MATINSTSSTNNANQVLYSYSTKLVAHSDRASGSLALHGEIASLTQENLGVAVALTDPFTVIAA